MRLGIPHAGGAGRCVLRHDPGTNIVRATFVGVVDLDAFARCAAEAVALAARRNSVRLLFDDREAQARVMASDIYRMPARAEEEGLTPRHRIAMLYATRTREPMDMLLWENVFVNRGYRARAFVDEDQALRWLAQE